LTELRRKTRGKGKRPALALVGVRLTPDVLAYFNQFPLPSVRMRMILTDYVRDQTEEKAE
jgi:hypothetical protein